MSTRSLSVDDPVLGSDQSVSGHTESVGRAADAARVVDDESASGAALASHRLLGVDLHLFDTYTEAAQRISGWARESAGLSVFTCNVDHLMLMKEHPDFLAAYRRADVVTIDGAPLALLSRWTGTRDARRVTGVDLTAALLRIAEHQGLRVALVGGVEGRALAAAANARVLFPGLVPMFADSPAMGFGVGDDEDDRLVSALAEYAPHIVIVCLGAPKQELWIDAHKEKFRGVAFVGAGATIDLMSGHRGRAPAVFTRTGTEAAYRLATDFRRLWRRYLVRDVRFAPVFAKVLLGYWTSAGAQRSPSPARWSGRRTGS